MRALIFLLVLILPFSADADTEPSAESIVARAHAAAGGTTWVKPQTLYMSGYGLFYRDGVETRHDRHEMWRVYPDQKSAAHSAGGKVRIDSFRDDVAVFQVAFDGQNTYTQDGLVEDAADSDRWQANFGYGVIRFALDDGYSLRRAADDIVDGRAAYTIIVTDPEASETLFQIAKDNFAILKVGFETPRGWHERIYSDFFSKPGLSWSQPGRVRLFYNGMKANEVIWTDFLINEPISDAMFVLPDTHAVPTPDPNPFRNIGKYRRAAYDRTMTACDEIGAHPNDPEKVGPGVERMDIDLEAVIAACTAAIAEDPDNPRLNYQLARAYGYSGRHADGNIYRMQALNAGYPQSLFVVGYIRLTGWDGAEANPCYGGELIRRSALVGRMAGLVGFPHYALSGQFAQCETYPEIDRDEMRKFLQTASNLDPDYYQRLLIDELMAKLDAN